MDAGGWELSRSDSFCPKAFALKSDKMARTIARSKGKKQENSKPSSRALTHASD